MSSKLQELIIELQAELAKTNTAIDPHTGQQIKSVAEMSEPEFAQAMARRAWRGTKADLPAAKKEWKGVR